MNPWLMAFRPKTLTAALVPILVGSAYVQSQKQSLVWSVTILALLASLFIQIGTNLFNDAIDFEKGADTEKRLGPTRVTQSGLLTKKQVYLFAGFVFFLALLCGIPLVLRGGLPIMAIGVFSLLFGYFYTGGPFPLAYKGWGDVFVIVFFGWIAVLGVVFLQTSEWSLDAFVLGTQVGLLSTVLIAVNNLRDVETDVLANKKTLAVRFGKKFVRVEILLLNVIAYGLTLYWLNDLSWKIILPLLTVPLSIKVVKLVFNNEPSALYNKILEQAAKVHLLYGLGMTVAFLLG